MSRTCIRNTFNFSVQLSASVGQNAKNELWVGLGGVTSLQPGFFECTVNVALGVSVGNWGSAVDDVLFETKEVRGSYTRVRKTELTKPVSMKVWHNSRMKR